MRRLQNERQWNAAREKLHMLQVGYERIRQRTDGNEQVRALSLRSFGRRIKQLKEEIMWYESHARVPESSGPVVTSASEPGETSTPCTN
jgi:hypothetical protein